MIAVRVALAALVLTPAVLPAQSAAPPNESATYARGSSCRMAAA